MVNKVVIIQRIITDYRVPFYLRLAEVLCEADIELSVLAGAPWLGESYNDCRDQLPFVQNADNIHIFGGAYWLRGAFEAAKGADLVIIENANRALHHYVLQIKRLMGSQTRCAFWGHGGNLNKSVPHPVRDSWRSFWIRKVDWWFAYTQSSAERVAMSGFPLIKITNVQNAIDTSGLREARRRQTDEKQAKLRAELFGDPAAAPTGVFCGRLVDLKWIPFLLESLIEIRKVISNFQTVIVGDGPDRQQVKAFSVSYPWCVCVGAKHGEDRVPYLALGDVWLNPGMTGLSVLDSFAIGLPFFTTDNGIHSPEIEYLKPNISGSISTPTTEAFAAMVVSVLSDQEKLKAMKAAAFSSGEKYTINNMAQNFAAGVVQALKTN